MDLEKEKTLENQAKELEQLKTMMKNKAAQDEERREFNEMKSQLMSLTHKLGDQATYEQEMENKSKRGGFNKSGGAMNAPERGVYFDDYARKNQPSPTRR